jgi:hypothetical protein
VDGLGVGLGLGLGVGLGVGVGWVLYMRCVTNGEQSGKGWCTLHLVLCKEVGLGMGWDGLRWDEVSWLGWAGM